MKRYGRIVVFMGNATAKVQNLTKCLSVLFFPLFFSSALLMSLGSHTWSAVIVSSRSAHTKWGISTDTV